MADPTLHREHRIIRMCGQRDQERLFLCEGFIDHRVGRGVNTRIGDLSAPLIKLCIQIIHVPECTPQEDVLPDIAEGSLHFAFVFARYALQVLGADP